MLNVLKEMEDTRGKFRSEILEDPFSKVENAIIKYAENENVDLIVMGSKGRSGIKRTLLGSVASAVLSYARCPVLIVR
jgi:nucleotide-binding universal stress UspA family protein